MNRYKVTFSDDTIMRLYANTKDTLSIPCFNDKSVVSIERDTDMSYMKYIDYIKTGDFIGYDYRHREIYRHITPSGRIYVRISKDESDGVYYEYADYQDYHGQLIMPIGWTCTDPDKVYNLLISSHIGYSVIQFRRFGEPKLTKPKELKGIKQLCSVDYIPKKNKSSLFLKENDVYVKHTDYFSPIWQPPTNDLGKPVAYYLKKYFNQTPSGKKFVYDDNWSSIVLRSEAWIKISNLKSFLLNREHSNVDIARLILDVQKKESHTPRNLTIAGNLEWERYWQRVVEGLRKHMND